MGKLDILSSADRRHLTTGCQIGHILERRLDPPTHVHNFAFPGATAEDDLSNQLSRFENSSYHLSLEGENTVHCTLSRM